MHFTRIIFPCLLTISVYGQDLPKIISVPVQHADPAVQFNVIHFDAPAKDQFSILYVYQVGGSVMSPGEFVQDTGQIVFRDKKGREPIINSTGALLVRKQVVDITGKELSTEDHLLSLRKLAQGNEYRLYFAKRAKEPVVANRSILSKSIYNVQQLQGLSAPERSVLADFCDRFIPDEPEEGEAPKPKRIDEKIVDDLNSVKDQFKAARELQQSYRGDLPRHEKVQTRFTIAEDRSFVVTKTKGDKGYLKFYFSDDNKTFANLDSAKVEGDVLVTSVATIYNMNVEAVGAFANFHYKYKSEKGEDMSRQYSFVMGPDLKIHGWVHSVGKDKLNSLAADLCWYEGGKFYVLSENRERVFKAYAQVHELSPGADAKLLFPSTEEEKGSEKTKFVSTFQAPAPMNASQVSPIPEKYVPMYAVQTGNTKYFISQGIKYNDAIKSNEYLTVKVYRFEPGGKITNIDLLSDFRAPKPLPMTKLGKYDQGEYFLLEYPFRVQLLLSPEKATLSQLSDANHQLLPASENSLVRRSEHGSLLLKKQNAGNKIQLLFYP